VRAEALFEWPFKGPFDDSKARQLGPPGCPESLAGVLVVLVGRTTVTAGRQWKSIKGRPFAPCFKCRPQIGRCGRLAGLRAGLRAATSLWQDSRAQAPGKQRALRCGGRTMGLKNTVTVLRSAARKFVTILFTDSAQCTVHSAQRTLHGRAAERALRSGSRAPDLRASFRASCCPPAPRSSCRRGGASEAASCERPIRERPEHQRRASESHTARRARAQR